MAMNYRPDTLTAYPMLRESENLAAEGRLERAAQRTIAHLRQHPEEPRGLAQLGKIALQLGALGQAEHFLRRALARGTRDFETRRSLASTLNQQQRLDEAAMILEALEKESNDPTLPAMRALILDKLGHHEDALALQSSLAEAHSDKPPYWIAYGHSLRAAGQVEEAVTAYRNAVRADSEYGEAWWGLASIKKRIFTDQDIVEMREALAIAVDVRNSAPLHFALARALHDRSEYEEAFRHYEEGNRQRARNIGYDQRELTAEVGEVIRSVDADYMARLDIPASDDDIPIFIISLPRSGSTLLEQMLGSHPDVEPVGELPYIPAILRSVMEVATRRGQVTVPQLIANITDEQASAMGRDYLRRAALHRKTGKRYFTDKLPHNWSNVLFIRRILPQARFIDIRRSPMDCCFSNFTQSFSSAHAASFALRDIGQCYVDYVHLMDHLGVISPNMVHHIRYERLIEEAESEIGAALDYLGLPWNPSVLDFHKLDRVVRTPSSEQVRRPLNRDGVKIWKHYERWLDPLKETLGRLAEG